MPFYIYSSENLPNNDLSDKPGYSPETFTWGGVTLPPLQAEKWLKQPELFHTIRRADWTDKQGRKDYTTGEEYFKVLKTRWGGRGVIILDHEPSAEEKVSVAAKSKAANLAYRMTVIERYEHQIRDREITGIGRTQPTPYEDECYSILGLTKPYSVEAMRAQRHPGEAVGEQIVQALDRLLARREKEAGRPVAPAPKRTSTALTAEELSEVAAELPVPSPEQMAAQDRLREAIPK